jgi:hypothetical protein
MPINTRLFARLTTPREKVTLSSSFLTIKFKMSLESLVGCLETATLADTLCRCHTYLLVEKRLSRFKATFGLKHALRLSMSSTPNVRQRHRRPLLLQLRLP